jgi:hypothetical protein
LAEQNSTRSPPVFDVLKLVLSSVELYIQEKRASWSKDEEGGAMLHNYATPSPYAIHVGCEDAKTGAAFNLL